MNLESLRQKILSQVKTVEVGGETYRLQKTSAIDGLAINALLLSLEMEGDGDEKRIKSEADLVRLYTLLLSKMIVDESGEKTLDSDEGRQLLTKLRELIELGNIASDWNTVSQKKS